MVAWLRTDPVRLLFSGFSSVYFWDSCDDSRPRDELVPPASGVANRMAHGCCAISKGGCDWLSSRVSRSASWTAAPNSDRTSGFPSGDACAWGRRINRP